LKHAAKYDFADVRLKYLRGEAIMPRLVLTKTRFLGTGAGCGGTRFLGTGAGCGGTGPKTLPIDCAFTVCMDEAPTFLMLNVGLLKKGAVMCSGGLSLPSEKPNFTGAVLRDALQIRANTVSGTAFQYPAWVSGFTM
jgi:hypothetical protein